MPKAVYHAYGYVKKAAAIVNAEAGQLEKDKAGLIIKIVLPVFVSAVSYTLFNMSKLIYRIQKY